MVNDRQSLDLTTFAAPTGGDAVEWLISAAPVPYPEAVAAMALNSTWRVLTGKGVNWRGRTYTGRPSRRTVMANGKLDVPPTDWKTYRPSSVLVAGS